MNNISLQVHRRADMGFGSFLVAYVVVLICLVSSCREGYEPGYGLTCVDHERSADMLKSGCGIREVQSVCWKHVPGMYISRRNQFIPIEDLTPAHRKLVLEWAGAEDEMFDLLLLEILDKYAEELEEK